MKLIAAVIILTVIVVIFVIARRGRSRVENLDMRQPGPRHDADDHPFDDREEQ